MKNKPVPLIDAEYAAFMQGGVSISVASTGRGIVPSQARALGCVISSDRMQVTLFLSAPQAADLLTDIRSNGPVAAVFSQPSTHRTVQLKGPAACMRRLSEADLRIVGAYREAFVQEVVPLGYDAAMIRAMLACPPEQLAAITFAPAAAFSQTPGPNAGEPLRPRA